jgi:hypothetical protein
MWLRIELVAVTLAELVREHHPRCKVILSTQFLPYEEQLTIALALDEQPA